MRKKSYIEQSADEGLISHVEARGLETALSGRGGPGRGQGAKSDDGAVGLRRINVSLDSATIDAMREHGDGQLSLGIRRAARSIKAQ